MLASYNLIWCNWSLPDVSAWLPVMFLGVEWILDADCAETPADHPFVVAFQEAAKQAALDPQLAGFGAHSDIGLPSGLGRTPTVNFGPGDPAQSHQPNERVSIRDLVSCTKAIALAIESWCRSSEPAHS